MHIEIPIEVQVSARASSSYDLETIRRRVRQLTELEPTSQVVDELLFLRNLVVQEFEGECCGQ